MNNVFVYCETEGSKVAEVSQELLTKGRKLANQLGVQWKHRFYLTAWINFLFLTEKVCFPILQHHIPIFW